jgi:glycosyltransferase involved in cell wall biosynthesis
MKEKYILIAPCFNEEKAIIPFLRMVENKLSSTDKLYTVIIVDDASNDSTLKLLKNFQFTSESFELKTISLNINSGHQEAIRQGLNYAHTFSENAKGIIIIDSDGEDNPDAIKELIKLKDFEIVYITRGRRYEGIKFKVGYFLYKLIFRILIGKTITFGNYSLISPSVLNSIYKQKFFHFAAFLSKQKFGIKKISYDRQKRIDGKSKMSYMSLVIHGLKSMIEYSEEILFFLIKLFVIILFFSLGLGITVIYKKFISEEAILGWTSSLGINLINTCLIIFGTIIICLILLSMKNAQKQNEVEYIEIK